MDLTFASRQVGQREPEVFGLDDVGPFGGPAGHLAQPPVLGKPLLGCERTVPAKFELARSLGEHRPPRVERVNVEPLQPSGIHEAGHDPQLPRRVGHRGAGGEHAHR